MKRKLKMRKKIIVTKKLFKHLQRTLISYKLSKTRREEGIKHKKLSKKLKKETIKQIETLTTHGFPNIFRSKHILVKIIWTILFLGALGLLIYLLYNNVNDYLEYNVTTVVRSINVDELDFPVITICNRNLASNQKGLEYFKYFFKQINKRNSKDFVSDDFDFIQDYYAYAYFYEIPIKERQNYSASIGSMLQYGYLDVDGYLDKQYFYYDDFVWIFNPYYGNCYQINTDSKFKSKRNLNSNIYLQIYSPLPEIFKNTGKRQSISIQISSKNSNSFIHLDNVIEISTGVKSFLTISKSTFNKYPLPYSDCQLIEDENENILFPHNFDRKYYDQIISAGYEYSQSICISFCQLDNIGSNCSLRISSINAPNNMDNYCPIKNDFQYFYSSSLVLIEKYFNNETVDKECAKHFCPLECKTNYYQVISTSSDKNSETQKDLIDLYIKYDSASYLNYEETPTISLFALLSNIGGVIGLLLGMSFLSLFELIELAISSIFYIIKHKYQKNKLKKKQSHSIV